MKTEWQFHFDVKGFRFDAERQFTGTVHWHQAAGSQQDIQFEGRVCPDDSEPLPGFVQTGSMFILLPVVGAGVEATAGQIAQMLAERLSFQGGHFKIHGGLVISRLLPETPEEESEVDDASCSMSVRLIEVVAPPIFDATVLVDAPSRPVSLGLVAQYNEACRAEGLIGQFLGLFRIVENFATLEKPRLVLKDAVKTSDRLRATFLRNFDGMDFDKFVDDVVARRHECAHLKLGNRFGYVPTDLRLESEVRPLLQQLQILARSCIEDA